MSQTIIEKCSCGATITATGSAYRNDRNPNNPRGVEEIVERWRVEHKHEADAILALLNGDTDD